MKILVLAGGLSPEREVSLTSGSLIAGALVRKGHTVCAADLYTGRDIHDGIPAYTNTPVAPYAVKEQMPGLTDLMKETGFGERRIAPNIPALWQEADVVFIALHGDVGENGQLQALLDMSGISYTGTGYTGSLLAMDKDLSKRLLAHAGIPTPPWITCSTNEDLHAKIAAMEENIGYPCVVKPLACGSSVGVAMVHDRKELEIALRDAAKYGKTILVEKMIKGREMTVSILGDRVLPPVEIIPKTGFYDYKNKYQAGCTEEICPAPLSPEVWDAMKRQSLHAFEVLRLRGYTRFDYILDENGTAWCLEANTLPGMTPLSLLPLSAKAAGIDYDTLCEIMVRMALEKSV